MSDDRAAMQGWTLGDLNRFVDMHSITDDTQLLIEVFDGSDVSTLCLTDATFTVSSSGKSSIVFNRD